MGKGMPGSGGAGFPEIIADGRQAAGLASVGSACIGLIPAGRLLQPLAPRLLGLGIEVGVEHPADERGGEP